MTGRPRGLSSRRCWVAVRRGPSRSWSATRAVIRWSSATIRCWTTVARCPPASGWWRARSGPALAPSSRSGGSGMPRRPVIRSSWRRPMSGTPTNGMRRFPPTMSDIDRPVVWAAPDGVSSACTLTMPGTWRGAMTRWAAGFTTGSSRTRIRERWLPSTAGRTPPDC